jgi:hypothetical protein
MTVYDVTNPNSVSIQVRHIITDTMGFRYEFTSNVPASSSATYRLREMAGVPVPFTGAMTLQSDQPFTAAIVSYEYPTAGTPVATPSSSPVPVPTPTFAGPSSLPYRIYLPAVTDSVIGGP